MQIDRAAGIDWWNELDDSARRQWLERAAPATPEGAWEAFKRSWRAAKENAPLLARRA